MKYYGCFRYPIWNGPANLMHIFNENSSHSPESQKGPMAISFDVLLGLQLPIVVRTSSQFCVLHRHVGLFM